MRAAVGTTLGCDDPRLVLGVAGARPLQLESCWDCGADLGDPSLHNMVLYLREITLSSKSGDSVYAKRLLLKTHFWHPCREAPLGAFKNRGQQKNIRFVHAKRMFFFAIPDGAYPPSRHVPKDVSRLFWSFRKIALSST